MRQYSIGVFIVLDQMAALPIVTQVELVPKGARFVQRACDHRPYNAFEHIEFPVLDRKPYVKLHRLLAHPFPPFLVLKNISPPSSATAASHAWNYRCKYPASA